jgi:hypothetical protein
VVEVRVWDLALEECPSSFTRTEAPYWEKGQAPPLITKDTTKPQQYVIEGLMASLGSAVSSTDHDELRKHLYALKWDFSDLQAFLATTAQIKTTTNEFVVRKRGRESWKTGRRVVIRGELTEDLIKERNTLSKKGYSGYILEVNEDDSCIIALDATTSSQQLTVPSTMILDEW